MVQWRCVRAGAVLQSGEQFELVICTAPRRAVQSLRNRCARLHVTLTKSNGDKQHIYRWMDSGGSFGANPLRVHFGLSDCAQVDSLEVHWPTTGKTQTFSNIRANQFIQVDEGKTRSKSSRVNE